MLKINAQSELKEQKKLNQNEKNKENKISDSSFRSD
jgi:hypothetical protein